MGSSHFARRYFGNRCFFLFLRLLRCFSSPGSPCISTAFRFFSCSDGGFLRRVSPFRDPWIIGHLHLPTAFRSLLRLSSALSAKASTLRSCLLTSFPSAATEISASGFRHVASCPPAVSIFRSGVYVQHLCHKFISSISRDISSDVFSLFRYFICGFQGALFGFLMKSSDSQNPLY